jgi:hypothetical protein
VRTARLFVVMASEGQNLIAWMEPPGFISTNTILNTLKNAVILAEAFSSRAEVRRDPQPAIRYLGMIAGISTSNQ